MTTEYSLTGRRRLLDWVMKLPALGPNWIAGGGLLVIVVLVTADVISRTSADKPLTGAYELSEFLMVFVVFFSLAYAQIHGSHISIGVVADRFPKKVQSILDSINYLIGAVLLALVTWQTIVLGITKGAANQKSLALGIPVSPLYYVAAVGTALFCLVLLVSFIKSLTGEGK